MKNINKILSDFENYIIESMETSQTPGVVIGIAKDNRVIYKKAFGVKKLGAKDPVDTQTIFQIGSITKAFTATLMAILVNEKKINWQDKVINFLPEFQMYDPWVTREFAVEDCFTHRTGLPPAAGLNLLSFGFDQKHLIHSLRYVKPVSSFRSTFCYQNIPYIVAGKIIENITGKSWEQNLQEHILAPLEMKHAYPNFAALCQKEKNFAFLHKTQNSKQVAIPANWPYHNWANTIGAGGSICANVDDTLKWLNFQLGYNTGKILPHETICELHRPIVTAKNDQLILLKLKEWQETLQYGLGWISSDFKPNRIVYHAGGTLGHTTMAAFIPENLSIVILTNNKNLLIFSLLRDFYDRYFGKQHRNWNKILYDVFQKVNAANKIPSKTAANHSDFRRYTGTYYNEAYQNAIIDLENGHLVMTLGKNKTRFALQTWNNTCFALNWSGGKNAVTPTFIDKPDFVTFAYDNFEQVESMTLTLLNELDGLGVFKKVK
jgi:CubicO group peptidase (beta-lactamase class C family)